MRPSLRFVISQAILSLAFAHVASSQRVEVRYPATLEGPRTGRVFVIFARDGSREPRLAAGSYGGTAPLFGADVSDWKPGAAAAARTSARRRGQVGA